MDSETVAECVQAIADLVGRSGAREFEMGYVDAEVEGGPETWYCTAVYRGAKLFVDDQPTPAHAADGLAHVILDGGMCTHCGEKTSTRGTPLGVYIKFGRSKKARCIWYRDGNVWKRGCE